MSDEELQKSCERSFRANVAIQIFAGLCSNPQQINMNTREQLARIAVKYADVLITELNKSHDHPD